MRDRLTRAALALALLGALGGIAVFDAGAADQQRAAAATRIVFQAGQAKQCNNGDCRPSRDVVRSISPHGSRLRKLAEIRSVIEISATEDGSRVAILSRIVAGGGANSASYTQIYLLSAHGALKEVFPHRLEGFNGTGLGISPNGKLLALAGRGRRADGFPAESKIWIVRPNGAMRRLTTGGGDDQMPAFSPSAKRIVFSRSFEDAPAGNRDAELFAVGLGGGVGAQLTDNAVDDVNPVFSPAGSRIAFGQYNARN